MSKPRRAWLVLTSCVLLLLLAAYCLSYYVMTRNGIYVPGAIGTNGVKWYIWEPAGFARADGRWGSIVPMVYLPLYLIDRKWWHVDDNVFNGEYPVRRPPVRIP